MAERVFKGLLKKKEIKVSVCSKGLEANGDNITRNAKEVLKERGYNSRDRKSVGFGKIDKETLYVTMTQKMTSKINGKVISMKDLIGEDVLDPYGYGIEIYRQTLNQIEKGCLVLLDKILKVRGEK